MSPTLGALQILPGPTPAPPAPHLCTSIAPAHTLALVGTAQHSSRGESVSCIRLQTPLGKTCVVLSFLTRRQGIGQLAAEWLSWPLTLLLVTPSYVS